MRRKVSDVVYRRFSKHWKSKNLWNANPPNSAKWWNLDIQERPADAGIPARRKNDEKNSSISKL